MIHRVRDSRRANHEGRVSAAVDCSPGVCLGVGFVSGKVTAPEIGAWYVALVKPPGTPPNWNALYTLMGICLWLPHRQMVLRARPALMMFLLQLALNAVLSVVFFGLHQVALALAVILAMTAAVAATIG